MEAFNPDETLPPFLRETEPMDIESLPLQVALLTMEVAALRARLAGLALAVDNAGDKAPGNV
jgi:hypothetical protein